MTRLTNVMRDTITARAVAHAFDGRVQVAKETEDRLAREAYNAVFSEKERALVSKVPENWFRLDACLRFNIAGMTIVLNVIGEGLPVPYRRAGTDDTGHWCKTVGVIPHGNLADRIMSNEQDKDALRKERAEAERSVRAMLNSVQSTVKLKEAWPEGEQFYADFDAAAVPAVPALRIPEINAMLGLATAA